MRQKPGEEPILGSEGSAAGSMSIVLHSISQYSYRNSAQGTTRHDSGYPTPRILGTPLPKPGTGSIRIERLGRQPAKARSINRIAWDESRFPKACRASLIRPTITLVLGVLIWS